jgi:N-acetyl-anhydromuramyl-L-alanine amidase AmpD
MKASSINNHESYFFKNKKDSDGKLFDLKEMSKKIKGTNEKIEFYDCNIDKDYKTNNPEMVKIFYVKGGPKLPKKQIVLHFTTGYLKGDLAKLTRGVKKVKQEDGTIKTEEPYRVSVPFIIGRNGRILKIWDEKKYWAYHLGPEVKSTYSQQTIGIEISNIGFLELDGDDLHTYYSKDDKEDIYCSFKNDKKYFTKLDKPFREKKYFATFTDAQYKSLIQLLKYLTKEHDIAPTFLPKNDLSKYKRDPEKLLNDWGIVSHVNYRSSGKWDLGPAFDWNRVIDGLKEINSPPSRPIRNNNNTSGQRNDNRTFTDPVRDDRTFTDPVGDNRTF